VKPLGEAVHTPRIQDSSARSGPFNGGELEELVTQPALFEHDDYLDWGHHPGFLQNVEREFDPCGRP
jgi:hypothetical protein